MRGELALRSSIPVQVATQQVSSGGLLVGIGPGIIIDLKPHSVRGPGFRLLEQRADGTLHEVDPGPERTYRGEIVGMPGAKLWQRSQPMVHSGRVVRAPANFSLYRRPLRNRPSPS